MNHPVKIGDRGQRYEVVATFNGIIKTIGWTEKPDGGLLMVGARKWPACESPASLTAGLRA